MDSRDLITINPDILGGVPVSKGTRVPIKTLFQYRENDYSLEEFLECFPSVTREAARKSWSALSRLCPPQPPHEDFCSMNVCPGGRTNSTTSDQNLRYQQNLAGRRIAILELSMNDIGRIQSARLSVEDAITTIGRYEFKQLAIP